MKITLKMLAAALLTATASSCSSFLDINSNPNSLTTDTPPTPALILAQALNNTATNYSVSYNSYASFAADYWGKSGVVSGYAEERTYNYTSNYYAGLWSATYDNLNDYQYIQTQGTNGNYAYHAAIARIMKAYNYLLLVDEYGNVPYTNALQGRDNLTPTYDRAQDIYADLIVQLKGAIADINATATKVAVGTAAGNNTIVAVGSEDIVFGGAMTSWKRFANSLQLRILLRESQTSDAALNATVASQLLALQTGATDGFITTDVVVNPGYLQSGGQQNPFFTTYGLGSGGGSATQRYYQIPTIFVLRQYINNKDPRVSQLYTTSAGGNGQISATYAGATTTGATTSTNTTGIYVGTNAGDPVQPGLTPGNVASFFRVGNISPTYGGTTGAGILKGLNAPTPLMLLSEHLFNKAEAETRGLFTGGDAAAKTDFNNGVIASFLTDYRTAATLPFTNPTAASITSGAAAGLPGFPQYTAYTNAGVANPLVNYDVAVTNSNGAQVRAIIFQKYLAENSIASTEALDDYRRTGMPAVNSSGQANQSYAGLGVNGTTIPYRLLYPQSEINTNNANLPKSVTQYTKIFWQN